MLFAKVVLIVAILVTIALAITLRIRRSRLKRRKGLTMGAQRESFHLADPCLREVAGVAMEHSNTLVAAADGRVVDPPPIFRGEGQSFV